jgi:hypothetical protein
LDNTNKRKEVIKMNDRRIVVIRDKYDGGMIVKIALTPDQFKLITWLKDNDFLDSFKIEYDDEIKVEMI